MPKRNRFQTGSLEVVNTSLGLCWYLRYTKHNADGTTSRPRARVGLKSEYPTRAAASRSRIAGEIRERIQAGPAPLTRTFGDVIARYELEEMPPAYATQRGYKRMHRLYIAPQWGATALTDMKAMAVRGWLQSLPYASRTKGHIHGQMRNLFKYAMLWEWLPAEVNPMSLFSIPGATKRTRTPKVITPAQFIQLLNDVRPEVCSKFGRVQGQSVSEPKGRALIAGAYLLGLTASELFGLKWSDFDWLAGKVWINRGIVEGHVGATKTERRESPLPLHPKVAAIFQEWMMESEFNDPTDWAFASPELAGEKPSSPGQLRKTMLRPAGERIGLSFNLGWHCFRHSYKVLLERAGVDVTVQRDLMRHSDVHTTMQVYGEVEMDRMREANSKAVRLALGGSK